MNIDNDRLHTLILEIVGITNNLLEAQTFLEEVQNPQGAIDFCIDLQWIEDKCGTRFFTFNPAKTPNVYKMLIDAIKKDMADMEARLKQCGEELSK